jgi:hypothetical protein
MAQRLPVQPFTAIVPDAKQEVALKSRSTPCTRPNLPGEGPTTMRVRDSVETPGTGKMRPSNGTPEVTFRGSCGRIFASKYLMPSVAFS